MNLNHPALKKLLQQAYSAEKAAAYAYQGHSASLIQIDEKQAVKQIEDDEWVHRKEIFELMKLYKIPVSKFYELKYYIIGKTISNLCYILGRFLPFYFAGRLESGNVCEYFKMKDYFNSLGIYEHDSILFDMGLKEKEHEIYFLEKIKEHNMLPFFEKFFGWGKIKSFNKINLPIHKE
jgi:hypothetical protein